MAVDHGGVGAERGEAGGVGVDVEAVRMAFEDLQSAFERGDVEQAAELAEAAADAGGDFAADESASCTIAARDDDLPPPAVPVITDKARG